MRYRKRFALGSALALSLMCGYTASAQDIASAAGAAAAVAPREPFTIWNFLGFNHGKMGAKLDTVANTPLGQAIHGMITDPLKEMLGLNDTILPIDDPANLESPNPAVQAAAMVAQEEAQVPQMVAGIEYLASIENACCHEDKQVKESLIAALDSCWEEVRFAAAKAFGQGCCCRPDVIKVLNDVVNKKNDLGYYEESSERVRHAAMNSINACAGMYKPDEPKKEEKKEEAPPKAEEAPGEEAPKPGLTTLRPKSESRIQRIVNMLRSPVQRKPQQVQHQNHEGHNHATQAVAQVEPAAAPSPLTGSGLQVIKGSADTTSRQLRNVGTQIPAVAQDDDIMILPESFDAFELDGSKVIAESTPLTLNGVVSRVDVNSGLVTLTFRDGQKIPVGSKIDIVHKYILRSAVIGQLVVQESKPGVALARPINKLRVQKISKGDKATLKL